MNRTPKLRTLSLVLACLFSAAPAIAAPFQSQILDEKGNPLPNHQFALFNGEGQEIASVQSDAKGNAQFPDLASGHYVLESKVQSGGHLKQEFDISNPGAAIHTLMMVDSSSRVDSIEVIAQHLKSARIDLSPKVGTTVYTVDQHMIDTLGEGDSTPFDEVLLRLPGVDKDSKASGSLHVRDDHGNVQYRVDDVQLPENISGFGQAIDTRLIQKIDFVTGALPAQYGLRAAGIVDIQTKEGTVTPGGQVGFLGGSNQFSEPTIELFGSEGRFRYFVSASDMTSNLGIENPLPTTNAIHDHTNQVKSFGSLSYFIDDTSRVGLLFGDYRGHYQIPNNPDQPAAFSLSGVSDSNTGVSNLPSSQLNENQTETNRFLVVSFQKSLGDINYQASAFHQYSDLHFVPDPVGDLVFNGVASDTLRSNTASGAQFDMSDKLSDKHTLRAGLVYTRQDTVSNNTVGVFQTDDTGAQLSTTPTTIIDNSGKTGILESVYVQDEWHATEPLTVNYGLRFDHVSAFINEQQLSPRFNLAYKIDEDTAFHAGFSRYFTPPPQELAAQNSINLYTNTTNAPAVPVSDNVKAERTSYFDAGISHNVNENLVVTFDAYYKDIKNLIDEGQFGQALILSPFNYEKGFAQGLEFSAVYNSHSWGGFLNAAYQKAQGEHIISGQSLFGPDELAYIANHYIYLDHDQTYTLSGGTHYHFGDSQISADFLYGSGLRRTPDGGAPNSAALPHYTTVNATLTHTWKDTGFGVIEGRLALLNIFDQTYLLRDGTGVGVGAPQYGARRTAFGGLTVRF